MRVRSWTTKESKQQKSPGCVSKASTNVSHFPVCVLIVWSGTRKGTLLHLAESTGHLNTSIRIRKRYLDPFILDNRWTPHPKVLKNPSFPRFPNPSDMWTIKTSRSNLSHLILPVNAYPQMRKGKFLPRDEALPVCHGSTAELHLFSWYVQP